MMGKNRWMLSLLLVVLSVLGSANTRACETMEQALNLMFKLNVVSAEYQLKAATGDPGSGQWDRRRVELVVAMVPAADLMAKKRYAEACAVYKQVARDFSFDLDKVRSMTVADYDRYDKKHPGKSPCSVTALVTRINELAGQSVQQAEDSPVRKYMDSVLAQYSYLYATDINAVCKFLQEAEVQLQGMSGIPDRSGGSVRRTP
ncbi:MAG: hypothetical protein BWK76_09670 [Desulfobulbaceae bacterium A2]|nr:MAG: hypothetical protein BWK76_09670 [Desulfobulbaceae bacterium A2]